MKVLLLTVVVFLSYTRQSEIKKDQKNNYNLRYKVANVSSEENPDIHFAKVNMPPSTLDGTDFPPIGDREAELIRRLLEMLNQNDINWRTLLQLANQTLILFNQIAEPCQADWLYFMQHFNAQEMWSLQFLDSWAKPEAGILKGNLKWLGSYDECLGISVYKNETNGTILPTLPPIPGLPIPNINQTKGYFNGQYCHIKLTPNQTMLQPLVKSTFKKELAITTAICIPATCNQHDLTILTDIFNLLLPVISPNLPALNITTFNENRCDAKTPYKMDGTDAIVIHSYLVILLLIAIGTLYDTYLTMKKQTGYMFTCAYMAAVFKGTDLEPFWKGYVPLETRPKSVFGQFWLCFSCYSNGKMVLSPHTEGHINCIHGLKFISICWIVLGNTYRLFTKITFKNIDDILNLPTAFSSHTVFSSHLAMDIFLTISGFLTAYMFFKKCENNSGVLFLLKFYIRRYIRFTAPLLAAIGFVMTLYYMMGDGPNWGIAFEERRVCRKNWWLDVLYINNYVKKEDQCNMFGWYLASEAQFYVLAPLIALPLFKWPKAGLGIISVFFIASLGIPGYLTYKNKLASSILWTLHDNTKHTEYLLQYYYASYCRMAPYLVGMFTAFLLYKNEKLKLHWIVVTVGWIMTVNIIFWSVYGPYFNCHNHVAPTLTENVLFNTLARPAIGVAISWTIIACATGHGGVVNSLLSWKALVPLSRLAFIALIINTTWIGIFMYSYKDSLYFDHPLMIMMFSGFLFITFLASFVFSTIFEGPIKSLNRLIFEKQHATDTSQNGHASSEVDAAENRASDQSAFPSRQIQYASSVEEHIENNEKLMTMPEVEYEQIQTIARRVTLSTDPKGDVEVHSTENNRHPKVSTYL